MGASPTKPILPRRSAAESSVPAAYALYLVEAVRACGGPADTLLEEVKIPFDTLTAPGARMSVARLIELATRALELSAEPGLGFVMGFQAPISRFGSLGFAVMAAATLRDALELIERYMPIITDSCRYRFRIEDGRVALTLEEYVDFGPARELAVFALSTAVWQLGDKLTGRQLVADVEFAFPEPEYIVRFAVGAPGTLRFGASANCVRFDPAYLELPILSADPAAARSASAQCERELSALEWEDPLLSRVRAALWTEAGELLGSEKLARTLGMAERTLKRRLAELGTSYTLLLEAERRTRACELLGTQASVDEIAEQLGYSDAANFTRAFRRWTGQSPRAFRQSARG